LLHFFSLVYFLRLCFPATFSRRAHHHAHLKHLFC